MLEGLEAQGELASGQGAFAGDGPLAEAGEVRLEGVFGAVDQAQVLAAADLDGGLDEVATGAGAVADEVDGFDDHAFAAAVGERLPGGGG